MSKRVHMTGRASPFDPTRIPAHAEQVCETAQNELINARTPEEVERANKAVARAIATDDLMREHCE